MNKLKITIGAFSLGTALLFTGCQSNETTNEVIEKPNMDNVQEEIAPQESQESQENLILKIVVIKGMAFTPSSLTVNPGDTIRWINQGIVVHDITEENSTWTSGNIEIGDTWEMVPTESFDYFCSIHPTMKGSVILNESE